MITPLSKENINEQLIRFSTADLENLVVKFPYFHQAHLLLAKKYQQESHPKFDEQLQMAALYSQDRELFYTLFNDIKAIATEPLTTLAPIEEVKPTPIVTEEIEPIAEPLVTTIAVEEKMPPNETTTEEVNPIQVPIEPIEAIANAPLNETNNAPLLEVEVEEAGMMAEDELESEEIELDEEESTYVQETSTPHFSLQSPHTFDEWLSAFADSASLIKSIQSHQSAPRLPFSEEDEETEDELEELIIQNVNVNLLHEKVEEETHYSKGLDRFIEEQVQKRKQQNKKTPTDAPSEPVLVTETLAKLYEGQKKYVKAISTYELLTLKYPEKKGLFAARIENLKKLL